jgi:hypothetical protein
MGDGWGGNLVIDRREGQLGIGFKIQNSKFKIQNSKFKIQNLK